MYQNLDVHQCRSKSPTECCAWLTLFLSTVVAWDMAPEYNFAVSIFGLVAVRSSDPRLISYMALLVPLLAVADFFFFFLASYSDGFFTLLTLIILITLKVAWTYFSARLMHEMNGTYLAFLDCVRGTFNWFKGLPSGSEIPPPEPMEEDLNGGSYQQK
mmetsp:Transcript_31511/g.40380  ORF Transcript_31511/g.40380 Transcript_31511/m.40380 type:complete len:158 (-) Transcript_31511:294-767(-)